MNLDISIDKNNHFPIYEQIKDQILGLIQTGQIKPGDRLPTLQELSVELLVNINTVALAYRDLTNNGTLISARGKGTFVAGNATEEEIQAFRVEKLQILDRCVTQGNRSFRLQPRGSGACNRRSI